MGQLFAVLIADAYQAGRVAGIIVAVVIGALIVIGLARFLFFPNRRHMAGPAQAPPAGWYPDPWGQMELRWWDGVNWTAHTAPGEQHGQGRTP